MTRKYRHVVRAFFASPWAILPEKYAEMMEFIQLRHAGGELTREEIAARIGHGSPSPIESAGGVALVNVFGALSQRMNMMTEISGGTSLEQISGAIDEALADDRVGTIVMNIDSPGGSVALLEETSNKIVAARRIKPVIAVANTMAASAAYRLLVSASEAVVTPSGMVGSVGVITSHQVTADAQEKAGISHQIIKLPANKAEGSHGQPISEEGLDHLTSVISQYYEQFVSFVSAERSVPEATIRSQFGRMFTSADALSLGMVDRIATLEQVLGELGIGQDATSAPSGRPAFSLEEFKMNPDIFGALVRAGMCPIQATEAEATNALDRFFAAKGIAKPASDAEQLAALDAHNNPAPAPVVPVAPTVPVAADSDRNAQIMAAVRLAALPEGTDRLAFAQELIADSSLTASSAMERIQTVIANGTPTAPVATLEPGPSAIDNLQQTARDAILTRHYGGQRPEQIFDARTQSFQAWTPSEGAVRNRFLQSLPRLAEECLVQAGVERSSLARLAPQDMAALAMGLRTPDALGIQMSSDGPAYNVSGMFSNILLDAANVTARTSYNEVPVTFPLWTRQADGIADFKQVHRVIGGEVPDPRAIPEDGEFEENTISESKEAYKLVVWGSVFSLTWQTVVNDQLGEFMKIPAKQATSMRRKQNKIVYDILKDNAALSSGTALFDNATHNNLTTGAIVYTTAFNTMRQKMAEQTGLDTGTTLNLDPDFVLYPPALAGDVEQFLASSANPAVGGSAAGSSGVANIWQGRMRPVQEAQLGAAQGGSDTALYHAASPMAIDTIEYAYLQGLETPALDRVEAFDRLAIRHRIYQAFAAKAIDYRGLQYHAGV